MHFHDQRQTENRMIHKHHKASNANTINRTMNNGREFAREDKRVLHFIIHDVDREQLCIPNNKEVEKNAYANCSFLAKQHFAIP